MATVHNLCSLLLNASRASHAAVAVPYSRTNVSVCFVLHRAGLVASVVGGDRLAPFAAGREVPVTPQNVAARRLWVGLKYRDGAAVLSKCAVVSKGSRRVVATAAELRAVAAGRNSSLLKARSVGTITVVRTAYGIIELQTALEHRVGGEVLCVCA